jgi:UDPglucose 6-dehydrogenase
MKTIGVIGCGFVGKAVVFGFKDIYHIRIYDVDKNRATHSLKETCNSDVVFICVPTPMRTNGEGTDLSILLDLFGKIKQECNNETIYVLKSTVPIGTTKRLVRDYGLKIIHNPEFLTAKNANLDFLTPSRIVIGGDRNWSEQIKKVYEDRFVGSNILLMSSDESEAVKYIANCFLATKVLFFNEVNLGLKQYNLDWNMVIKGVLTDGRISYSHTQVPGPDGQYGFSGTCFPKDLCSLIEQIELTGFEPLLLKACWKQNLFIREDKDWETNPSAVTQK